MEPRRGFWREQGQSLVVVALMLVVLVGFLGLVLDGGNFWSQRRFLQNGADAGALAGARVYATTKDASQATAAARNYAASANGLGDPLKASDQVTVEVSIQGAGIDQTVAVTVTKVFRTYFLGALGIPSFVMRASAVAGLSPAEAIGGLLPLAVKKSAVDAIRAKFSDPTADKKVYIYDDDKDVSDYAINKIADGERGWINFDKGDVSTSELKYWIDLGGYPGVVDVGDTGVWINGSPGSNNSALGECEWLIGKKVFVPVYDTVRDAKDRPLSDADLGSGSMDYHFVGFAALTVVYIKDTGTPKILVGTLEDEVHAGKPGGKYDLGVYVVGLRR